MLSFTDLAVDLTEADSYALARGWSDWAGDDTAKTAALRRGQDAIARTFNGRWADDGWGDDDTPDLVRFAIIEAARKEMAEPGAMSPERLPQRIKAGSVEIEYPDGSSSASASVFGDIEDLLESVLVPSSGATVDLLRV